jgi:hypothetical protein
MVDLTKLPVPLWHDVVRRLKRHDNGATMLTVKQRAVTGRAASTVACQSVP